MHGEASQPIIKYPRTPHLEGSAVQAGDDDLEIAPFDAIAARHLVVEEKVDGANVGIWFSEDGQLQLQSRGHLLVGGKREGQFAFLKQWAPAHADALWRALGSRHVLYGEWLYAKHKIFYDALPHYLLEFDILDRETGIFLSTERRRALLDGLPIVSVPVLYEGQIERLEVLTGLLRPSLFKTIRWRERLRECAAAHGIDPDQALRDTDPLDLAEGLYVKVEEGGRVVGRYKWIRAGFRQLAADGAEAPAATRIIPNQLAPGVDLYVP